MASHIAASCVILYFYIRPDPLLAPIYWSLVFIALNVYWICRLLLERRPIKLTEEEQRLCHLVFRTLTPRKMLKLLKLARWENAGTGECFTKQGKALDRIMVIYSGKACVEVDGETVDELQAGEFIGDMASLPTKLLRPISLRSSPLAMCRGQPSRSKIS